MIKRYPEDFFHLSPRSCLKTLNPKLRNGQVKTTSDKSVGDTLFLYILQFTPKATIEIKRLKEFVRHNIERFEGDDFMFQLIGDRMKKTFKDAFCDLEQRKRIN
ncbi:MAG: ORF6N domain-containing protein [Tannerellaceae bacterium]|jgi:hypothetical protein|nr:ORF6N domain-containing protein [Tannerellaceae bacterium]